MKYKEAMAIGSVLDGVIKCTWAEIFDAEGNKVFTLQDKRFHDRMLTATGKKVLVDNGNNEDIDSKDNVSLDLVYSEQGVSQSVCECRRYVDGYRVPVVLNAKVLRVFQSAMDTAEHKYSKYKEVLDGLLANPQEEHQWDISYSTKLQNARANVSKWSSLLEKREKQIADIEAGKEFWVKVKAFEWYPLNTQNVSSEVQQAEADLKRAKQLLAASAVATVI